MSRGSIASARDPDALALPAGELVRETVEVRGVQADAREQVARAIAGRGAAHTAQPERLAEDLPDALARVQRRLRGSSPRPSPPGSRTRA
jgi:hypothetical protein